MRHVLLAFNSNDTSVKYLWLGGGVPGSGDARYAIAPTNRTINTTRMARAVVIPFWFCNLGCERSARAGLNLKCVTLERTKLNPVLA